MQRIRPQHGLAAPRARAARTPGRDLMSARGGRHMRAGAARLHGRAAGKGFEGSAFGLAHCAGLGCDRAGPRAGQIHRLAGEQP